MYLLYIDVFFQILLVPNTNRIFLAHKTTLRFSMFIGEHTENVIFYEDIY